MPERANPDTCRHRVIEAFVEFGGGVGYACVSCDSYIDGSFFEGRVWKFLPEHDRWEQVGRTKRRRG